MSSNNKELKQQYEHHSDEQLIEIVTNRREEFPEEEVKIAEAILTERGYNLEYEEEKEDVIEEPDIMVLELPDGTKLYTKQSEDEQSLNVTDRIDSIIEGIEENEIATEKFLEKKYEALADEELLFEYLRIMEQITEQKVFGRKGGENSLDNYGTIVNILQTRKLSIPPESENKHQKVLNLMYYTLARKASRKGSMNLVIGILLSFVVVLLLAGGLIRITVIILVIFAGQQIISAVKSFNESKDFKRKIKYDK